MRTKLYLVHILILVIAGLTLLPGRASALEPTNTPTATPVPIRFFNVRPIARNLDTPAGPLQDVTGRVSAKNGFGIDGVLVRAFSNDWQAFEPTRDGGRFKFTLSRGTYTIQLVDMVAQELKITLDGKTELQVEFYEVESLPPTPTSPPASPTVTPTATASPTSTPTPLSTSTAMPLPTNVAVAAAPKQTATATPAFPMPSLPTDIDPLPWLQIFMFGAYLGGGLIFLGLLVSVVRR